MTFRLGYGTNGFADHRLADALSVIADLGYTAVALTLDHRHLDPYAPELAGQLPELAGRLDRLGLRVVVETGARYLLDPYRKHHPTLISDGREVRIDLLARAIRIAAELGADCVSFFSGSVPAGLAPEHAWQRLRAGVAELLPVADRAGVPLGLEPEPGMLVERLDDALRLRTELGEPSALGITLDVGHCVAVEPTSAPDCLRRAAGLLVNVQLDDMRPGVHEHLEFGAGELDLAGCLAALDEIGYTGVAAVELPRHSHAGPELAASSIAALRAALPWLVRAEQQVRQRPEAIASLFPAAGRQLGRASLAPATDPAGLIGGTADDQARIRLIGALAAAAPDRLAAELETLYRYGDDAERRGVLRALTALEPSTELVTVGLELVRDAVRSNDLRLLAAAVGEFAAGHLDQHGWRHAVLKCLFTGVPLAAVAGLHRRADAELARMVTGFAEERTAAGRSVPSDALALLDRLDRLERKVA
ncbi:MAG TPA: EboA domain-containing protein [Jatrophihabitans sp.]|nr:EboA domain-containing protein [Jatrophihabitans sp.]